jgi:hypothetical protein
VEVTVTGSAKSIFEYEVAGAYALVVRTKKENRNTQIFPVVSEGDNSRSPDHDRVAEDILRLRSDERKMKVEGAYVDKNHSIK